MPYILRSRARSKHMRFPRFPHKAEKDRQTIHKMEAEKHKREDENMWTADNYLTDESPAIITLYTRGSSLNTVTVSEGYSCSSSVTDDRHLNHLRTNESQCESRPMSLTDGVGRRSLNGLMFWPCVDVWEKLNMRNDTPLFHALNIIFAFYCIYIYRLRYWSTSTKIIYI